MFFDFCASIEEGEIVRCFLVWVNDDGGGPSFKNLFDGFAAAVVFSQCDKISDGGACAFSLYIVQVTSQPIWENLRVCL